MLKIEGLSFQYKDKAIFKDASLEIENNKLHIIIGPNGAGKSTLLKILTGNIKCGALGCRIQNDFKDIFYLPQNPFYPKGMSTFDYVSSIFFKDNFKWFLSRREKSLVDEALCEVELYDKKYLDVENLSAGEIQKANIALGLLSGADLFLLDEPASNMDLINQVKILKKMKSLSNKGITSVVIMHDLNLSLRFGDYFMGIGDGCKISKATRDNFFTNENLKRLFGIDFEIIKTGIESNGGVYVQIAE